MTTIVVSAVNLRKGGTLTILRDCLKYLSSLKAKSPNTYRIIALVHKKELADYNGIEYIEISWSIKSWAHRMWCEYVVMHKISKKFSSIDLWFSLHDTTPYVKAKRQAVYCQTSFPFFKWKLRDFHFNYKIPIFAIFTRYAYQINIRKNQFLVVQQEWLRRGFSSMFRLPEEKFIVAPPQRNQIPSEATPLPSNLPIQFIYPATPDCHKNLETLCEATELLEQEIGVGKFTVVITISGKENKYAKWLFRKWSHISSLKFSGYMPMEQLYDSYYESHCLVFPSKIETWGLPISEFSPLDRPMLLADLPYAHETAQGASHVSFFPATSTLELKKQMKLIVDGETAFMSEVIARNFATPYAMNWEGLFQILLQS